MIGQPEYSDNEELNLKADAIARQEAEGELDIFQFEWGAYVNPHPYDFEDWIKYPEAYIEKFSEIPSEQEKIDLLNAHITNLSADRAKQLIETPNLIKEDELIEWKRNLLKSKGTDNCHLLALIPVELDNGIKAAVIIICYTNIPGGESELVKVFETYEKGQEFFNRYSI